MIILFKAGYPSTYISSIGGYETSMYFHEYNIGIVDALIITMYYFGQLIYIFVILSFTFSNKLKQLL